MAAAAMAFMQKLFTYNIMMLGMNRKNLVKARRQVVICFLKDYKVHQSCGDEIEFCNDWEVLKEDMAYPSLYEKLIMSVRKRHNLQAAGAQNGS